MLHIILYILIGAAIAAAAVYGFIRLGRQEEAQNPRLAEEKMVMHCGDESLIKLYLSARSDEERAEIAVFARKIVRVAPAEEETPEQKAAGAADEPRAADEEEDEEQALVAAILRLEGGPHAGGRLADLFAEYPQPEQAAEEETEEAAAGQAEAPAKGLAGKLRGWLRPEEKAEADEPQATETEYRPVPLTAEAGLDIPAAPIKPAAEAWPAKVEAEETEPETSKAAEAEIAPAEAEQTDLPDTPIPPAAPTGKAAEAEPADSPAALIKLATAAVAKQAEPSKTAQAEQPAPARQSYAPPVCRYCGAEVEPDCKFCIICGMPVEVTASGRAERTPPAQPRPEPSTAETADNEQRGDSGFRGREDVPAPAEQDAPELIDDIEDEEEEEASQSLAYSVQEILESVRELERRIMEEAELDPDKLYGEGKNHQ